MDHPNVSGTSCKKRMPETRFYSHETSGKKSEENNSKTISYNCNGQTPSPSPTVCPPANCATITNHCKPTISKPLDQHCPVAEPCKPVQDNCCTNIQICRPQICYPEITCSPPKVTVECKPPSVQMVCYPNTCSPCPTTNCESQCNFSGT